MRANRPLVLQIPPFNFTSGGKRLPDLCNALQRVHDALFDKATRGGAEPWDRIANNYNLDAFRDAVTELALVQPFCAAKSVVEDITGDWNDAASLGTRYSGR